jgi:hypothetical protein
MEVASMKIGWRDSVATLLVAAIVVPYIGYLVRGSMPFIQDPRGMAGTGLILGIAAAAVLGWDAFLGSWGAVAAVFAVASCLVGLVTVVWAEQGALSEGLLAVFIAAIAVTWALAELVHTGFMQAKGSSARR